MIIIYVEVNNTRIIIHDYEFNNRLERILSIWDPVYFKVSYSHFRKKIKSNKLIIPGYFSIDYLKNILSIDERDILFNYNDNPGKEINISLIREPRDKIQKRSINFLIDELHPDYNNNPSAMLNLETGYGKTYCAINFIYQLGTTAIVLVDQNKILEQWRESILKFTNIAPSEICAINSSHAIDKLFNINNNKYKIYLGSLMTLISYTNGKKWNLINKLFKYLGIGLKIFDEAHILFANQFSIDANTNVWKNIYLTATPKRSDKIENKIYQLSFSDIPKFGMENENIKENYHTICYVNINTKAPFKVIQECNKNRYGFDSKRFGDYCFKEVFNKYIEVIDEIFKATINKNKNKDRDDKIALVVEKNEHVEILYNHIKENYKEFTVGKYSGLIENKQKRNEELNNRIIVTTLKSFGKALDIPKLRYLICLTTFSSQVITKQLLGRLRNNFNSSSIYFDICDVSIRNCLSHRKYRRAILDDKAKNIITIDL